MKNIFIYELSSTSITSLFNNYILNLNNQKNVFFSYFIQNILKDKEDTYFFKINYFENDKSFSHLFKIIDVIENKFVINKSICVLYSYLTTSFSSLRNNKYILKFKDQNIVHKILEPMSFFFEKDDLLYNTIISEHIILKDKNIQLSNNFLTERLIQNLYKKKFEILRKAGLIIIEKNNIIKSSSFDFELEDVLLPSDSLFLLIYNIPTVLVLNKNKDIEIIENHYEYLYGKSTLQKFLKYNHNYLEEFKIIL